nr:putative ribonuclease H-like domain-containing protein [Tanacetum cinerariifolium]
TNESVTAVASVSAASTKVPVSTLPNVDNLSDDVIYSFFASQSNNHQLDKDDLKQIDTDDLEEINLKWQMAMLTMRARRFLQRTRRNLGANGTISIGFDISKVECYNYHRRGHFIRDCRSPRDTRNKDTQRRNVLVETSEDEKEFKSQWNHRIGRNSGANETTSIGFDMSKVECYNCHKRGHFVRDCRSPSDTRNKDTQRRNVSVETSTSNALVSMCDGASSYDWSFHADEEPINYVLMSFISLSSFSFDNEVAPCSKACTKAYDTLQSHYDKLTNDLRKSQFDVLSYKTGLESVEARLVVYQQNKNVLEEDIKLFKLDAMLRDNALVELRKKFENAEKEIEELKLKLEKFQTSSKNLSKLLASQITDKTGLGYDTQVFTSTVFDCDELISSESDVSMPTSPMHDRYQSGKGYHAVHPPYTGNFMPPKLDLVFHDALTACETVPNVLQVEPSTTKPHKDMSQLNRPYAPIIKDWVSDSKDESESELMSTQQAPSFVQTSKHVKTPRLPVKTVEHPTPAENLRKDIPKTRAVLTGSRLVPLTAARPVTTGVPQTNVTRPRPAKTAVNKPHSPIRRPINHKPSHTTSNFHHKVTTVKAKQGNPQHALKDKGVIDSGCSRHITGNISYLSDFKEINGGYVAFDGNPKGGKIIGKGKIRTGKLDFNDVYFVKELKFNLFIVSQMCDKKNSVLFTDTECIVLSFDFKVPDDNHVLLRVPRENNMYNVDLKNMVPSGDLTYLFANATLDKSNLWHRRLGHINIKTMNKLVKGNLVRGLPSKVFENNHTCVACKKGKKHRASCKTKPASSVSQPLQRLHMDLFGPTFVKSLNKKSYCLVVTDDYSRFSLVFLLATKDETSTILKTFITGIEKQINLKVKIIKSDNGTEFKNQDLNRVLVTKPHNKTPYELLLGRTPSIGFMRPFGCPVTILNTLDTLGIQENFDAGKAGKGNVQQYVLFPLWSSGSKDSQNIDVDATFKAKEPESEVHVSTSSNDKPKKHDEKFKREAKGKSHVELSTGVKALNSEFKEITVTSTNGVNAANTPVTAIGPNSINSTNNFSDVGPFNTAVSLTFKFGGKCRNPSQYPDDPNMPELEDITYSDDEEVVGAEASFSNLETSITVSLIPTTRVHKDHPIT